MNASRIVPGLLIASLLGCAASQLKPGAERIIVSRSPAPDGCKFVGTVTGSQGNAISGPVTSNRNLAEGAMNDLKNKALGLGANYVVLETNQAGFTSSGEIRRGTGSSHGQQTDVTNVGTAYSCPPGQIGLN